MAFFFLFKPEETRYNMHDEMKKKFTKSEEILWKRMILS